MRAYASLQPALRWLTHVVPASGVTGPDVIEVYSTGTDSLTLACTGRAVHAHVTVPADIDHPGRALVDRDRLLSLVTGGIVQLALDDDPAPADSWVDRELGPCVSRVSMPATALSAGVAQVTTGIAPGPLVIDWTDPDRVRLSCTDRVQLASTDVPRVGAATQIGPWEVTVEAEPLIRAQRGHSPTETVEVATPADQAFALVAWTDRAIIARSVHNPYPHGNRLLDTPRDARCTVSAGSVLTTLRTITSDRVMIDMREPGRVELRGVTERGVVISEDSTTEVRVSNHVDTVAVFDRRRLVDIVAGLRHEGPAIDIGLSRPVTPGTGTPTTRLVHLEAGDTRHILGACYTPTEEWTV